MAIGITFRALLFRLALVGAACSMFATNAGATEKGHMMESSDHRSTEIATFGGGCFWCVEAVFQKVNGVASVTSGYKGGHISNPSYQDVTTGTTGHAEVVQIEFDPDQVSYKELVEIFWKAHDPTQLNRQGADVGTQYRSVIFYHSADQKRIAEASRDQLNQSGRYSRPIVTEISPASDFFVAEAYHQNYFRNNPHAPYSLFVIQPKLRKLSDLFE